MGLDYSAFVQLILLCSRQLPHQLFLNTQR